MGGIPVCPQAKVVDPDRTITQAVDFFESKNVLKHEIKYGGKHHGCHESPSVSRYRTFAPDLKVLDDKLQGDLENSL